MACGSHVAREEPGCGPPDSAKSVLMGFGVARGQLARCYHRPYNTVILSPHSTILCSRKPGRDRNLFRLLTSPVTQWRSDGGGATGQSPRAALVKGAAH